MRSSQWPAKVRYWLIPLLIGGWLYILFLHGLGERDLWNSHEARAGMNARAVLDGDWLLPHLNDGTPELQKPPLYYWLVALVARCTGGEADALAVRLPSALAGILSVGAVALFGWRMGRGREGLAAALILATAVHFTWLSRVGRIDIPLTLAVSAAILSFAAACRTDWQSVRTREDGLPIRPTGCLAEDRRLFLTIGYLSLGVSILLKGPIGPILVAAALGPFLLWEGRLRSWKCLHELGVWWGVPLMLAVSLPWFLAADQATDGELTRVFFWYHNVERGLGGSNLRSHPWWLYGPRFLADFAPWSVLVPVAAVWFLRLGRWREDREARLGLAWFLGMTIVLSLARYKRADYLAPAYPGAALFLGCVLFRKRAAGFIPAAGMNPAARLSIALCVMLVSALGWWVRVEFVLPRSEPRLEQRTFARIIREHVPSPEPVFLFQTEAHALAFHLGKPVRTVLHWEDLDRLAEERPAHAVLPAAQAEEWRQRLRRVRLEELARNAPGHEKPMVLYRVSGAVRTTSNAPAR